MPGRTFLVSDDSSMQLKEGIAFFISRRIVVG